MPDEFFDEVTTPEEKITRGKTQLVQNNPFFGYLALKLKPTPVDPADENATAMYGKVLTMAVDYKGQLLYNPKWVMKLDDNTIQWALAHEISHLTFIHNIRFPFHAELEGCMDSFKKMNETDPKKLADNLEKLLEMKDKWALWNIAGDVKINDILMDSGFQMLEGYYSSRVKGYEKYKDMITEEIFDDLLKNTPKQTVKVTVCGGMVPGLPGKEEKSQGGATGKELEIEAWAKAWEKAVIEAATIAHQQGKLPAEFQRYVDFLFNPPVLNWWGILQRYIQRIFPVDYTWKRPSRKSRSMGYYLPSTTKEHLRGIIALDVSGSISDENYNDFINQMNYIARQFRHITFTVLMNDASVKGEILENAHAWDQIREYVGKRKGYGGTDFKPVFEWIEENDPNARLLIFFTDLYGDFPTQEPGYPTIWVCNNAEHEDAPFGTTIRMNPPK